MYKRYYARFLSDLDDVLETVNDSLARTGRVEKIVSVVNNDAQGWTIIVEVI